LSLHNTVFERRFGDLDYDEEIYHEADKPIANWNFKKLVKVLYGRRNGRAKAAAARTLGDIGDKRATPALISALRDNRARVREAAAQALGKISDERAIKPIILALRDKDKYVRLAATRSLGRIGYKQAPAGHGSVIKTVNESTAIKGLILASNDKHWLVRQAAREVLSKLKAHL
jgi:HEAT repeat protein